MTKREPIVEDDEEPCLECDGEGRCWNNADPTSGQFHECDKCEDGKVK